MSSVHEYRGMGRTTAQIQALPKGGVFVWCNNKLEYPKLLAKKLGREDIHVVGPSWITNRDWRGMELKALEADHAISNNQMWWHEFHHAQTRVRT